MEAWKWAPDSSGHCCDVEAPGSWADSEAAGTLSHERWYYLHQIIQLLPQPTAVVILSGHHRVPVLAGQFVPCFALNSWSSSQPFCLDANMHTQSGLERTALFPWVGNPGTEEMIDILAPYSVFICIIFIYIYVYFFIYIFKLLPII